MNIMNTLKTKDATTLLGVSQTTIKRWASHFPATFQKDRLGHYVFSERDISLLLNIKEQVELGRTLDQISLPASPQDQSYEEKLDINLMDDHQILSRIHEVERSLSQKADEVVSAQVLQHRAEIDELRQVIGQLAATVETLQGKLAKPSAAPREEFRLPNSAQTPAPPKKRGFFRSFF